MQQNYFCEKCGDKHPTKLVKKASSNDEVLFGCPRCHSQFNLNNGAMIKLAQFGGSIPKPTMSGPGASPVFKGTSTRSRGVNTRMETSIDTIISRTHRPAPIDPERNVEKRLEQFHVHGEEDRIPYDLDPKERHKLKIKKEIRRREKFYEDAAKRVEENSVEFINENFHPSEEQITSLEESLSSRRKYDKSKPKSITEDVSPDQITPTRRHTVAKVKHGLTTVFMDPASDDDPNLNPGMLTVWPMVGNYGGTLNSNAKLDDYLDTKNVDLGQYLNKSTNSFDNPDPDSSYGSDFSAKNLPSTTKFIFDPEDTSLEEGLDALMVARTPNNLPQVKAPSDTNMLEYTNTNKEPRSVFEKYPLGPAGIGITPMPKNSLK